MHFAIGPLLGIGLGGRRHSAIRTLIGQDLRGIFIDIQQTVVIIVRIRFITGHDLSKHHRGIARRFRCAPGRGHHCRKPITASHHHLPGEVPELAAAFYHHRRRTYTTAFEVHKIQNHIAGIHIGGHLNSKLALIRHRTGHIRHHDFIGPPVRSEFGRIHDQHPRGGHRQRFYQTAGAEIGLSGGLIQLNADFV